MRTEGDLLEKTVCDYFFPVCEKVKKPVFKTTPCVEKIKFLKSWEKVDSDGRIELPVAELVGIATKIIKIG